MKALIRHSILLLVLALAPGLALAKGDANAGSAKAAVCGACHGADGNSAAPNFPKLAGQQEIYLLKQMKDIQSGKRVVMEMTGMLTSLSEQDLADIAAHYAAQKATLVGAKDKDLELGKKIYLGGNHASGVAACAGCHSPTGNGNGPFPQLGGQHPEYIIKQLKAFRHAAQYSDDEAKEALKQNPAADMGRRNDGDARIMRDVTAHMTDREIEAVANYLSGLH